jgi:AcrR family transcriptional regulator
MIRKAANPSESTGRADRWAGHRQKRRAELVESAIEAVREHGSGVSVAAIAAQAGVTKPVLYRHFVDRADMRRAISERAAGLLLEQLLPQLSTERPPVARVRAIVDTFLAAAQDEPELWRFVVHNHGDGQHAGDVVAHNIALVADLLTAVLVDELRNRGKDAGGAEAWSYGLAGMVYTAGDWWLQRQTMSRSALTDYLTDMIWGGLSAVLGSAESPSASTNDGPEDANATSSLRLVAGSDQE